MPATTTTVLSGGAGAARFMQGDGIVGTTIGASDLEPQLNLAGGFAPSGDVRIRQLIRDRPIDVFG